MIEGSVTVKPQVFAAAVKWVAKFVATKPVVPMQAAMLIELDGGQMVLSAFSESASVRAVVPAEGDGAGSAAVSGRLLDQLVATFPAKPVTIAGDNAGIDIAAGRWNGTLPGMPIEDFPAMPKVPATIGSVAGEEFAGALRAVAAAASSDFTKQIALTCMHLTFGEDDVAAVATDSLRACSASAGFMLAADLGGPVSALVPAQVMTDAAAAMSGPDRIEIGWDAGGLSLTSPTRVVVLRQLGEQFNADMIRKFTIVDYDHHAQVRVADLLAPIKRAEIVRAKDGPIGVTFSAGMVTVIAEADEIEQRSGEEVDAQYESEPAALLFNPKYLGDALTSAPSEVVDIAFRPIVTGERPKQIVLSAAGTDWRHALMPIKPMK